MNLDLYQLILIRIPQFLMKAYEKEVIGYLSKLKSFAFFQTDS